MGLMLKLQSQTFYKLLVNIEDAKQIGMKVSVDIFQKFSQPWQTFMIKLLWLIIISICELSKRKWDATQDLGDQREVCIKEMKRICIFKAFDHRSQWI